MRDNNIDIPKLIADYLLEVIDKENLDELNKWREESIEHERLFKKICDTENLKRRYVQYALFNKEAGIRKILSKTVVQRRKHILHPLFKYASLILIPLSIVLLYIFFDKTPADRSSSVQTINEITTILPGESKAVLTLENGEQKHLLKETQETIKSKQGTTIRIDKSGLKYKANRQTSASEEETYNRIDIPRGGEYMLTLSDQSKVHLNAMSSLRFPVQFTNENRIVELEGEAYFQIIPDSKPFIVRIDGVDIEVLGTSFNVSAYKGENVQTTLVNGIVKITPENQTNSYTLRPDEQAIYDLSSKKIEINKVDASLYTSWINGKIYFKDQRLETIMTSLSRWYDMEVEYENEETKNIRFGCNLNRYQSIIPFINLLEETGSVKVEIEGKKIIIKSYFSNY